MIPVEYLAGFVDGEGYLGIAKIRRRNRSPEYCLRVSIYNSDRVVLEQIRRVVGGTMSAVGQRRPGWKPAYALIWTNAAAAGVIRWMRPFLHVKSRQSAALLAFNERIRCGGRTRDRAGHLLPLSAKELRIRENSYARVKRLNRRGPGGLSDPTRNLGPRKRSGVSPKYLAGFIDAEGSLMITRAEVADCRTPQYHPRIAVANSHKGVLLAIQGSFGGIMTYQPARKAAWKPGYQLVWTDRMVGPLLQLVEAHLKVKRKQARVLQDFIRHRRTTKQGRNGHGFAALPTKVVAFRENLRREIKALNRRGTRQTVKDSLRRYG